MTKPSDIVDIEERARTAISLGESHFREFKSALQGTPDRKEPRSAKSICRDIGEALVAFANADGGELLVGVEDDGAITGLNALSSEACNLLDQAVKSHVHPETPLPPIRIANLNLDGQNIKYFSVLKSTSYVHLTADGRCVQRRDLETVPIPPDQIDLDRLEKGSREYDRAFVDGASAADLNADLAKAVADQVSVGMSTEKCLQYLDLAEFVGNGLRLRRAALLLFAREPVRWHPRLQIRILKIKGTELGTGANYNVTSDQLVNGNILELLERGWESLRPQLVQTRLGSDARFGTTIMYPELACREALVNALAHRDYSDEGRAIEIFVYDDRMEVRNPGQLLSSINIDELLKLEGAHQSRNSMIARVLRELGYMRELGEGIRRIFELMKMNELTSPVVRSGGRSFAVTLRHNTIYSEQQLLWLDQFAEIDLDREQKAIVVMGMDGKLIAPQNIIDNLGIVDTERYRQLIRSLQLHGILESAVKKNTATQLARKQRVSVREIPRFRIETPRVGALTSQKEDRVESTEVQSSEFESISEEPHGERRLFLGNLAFHLEKAELITFLEKFGEVQSVHMPLDYYTGRKRGFAFVEFSSIQSAIACLSEANGSMVADRPLVVRYAVRRVAAS